MRHPAHRRLLRECNQEWLRECNRRGCPARCREVRQCPPVLERRRLLGRWHKWQVVLLPEPRCLLVVVRPDSRCLLVPVRLELRCLPVVVWPEPRWPNQALPVFLEELRGLD